MVEHASHPSDGRKHKIGKINHGSGLPGQKARTCLQNNHSEKGQGMAQAAEHQPTMCEALSSHHNAIKKKERGREEDLAFRT
jgi:hypothetical protein